MDWQSFAWDTIRHLYLFLPAAIANMAPVLCKPIFPWLATPLDLGARLRGKRILGNHKTIRGLLAGITAALCTAYLQQYGPATITILDYSLWPYIGLALGMGALGGDLIKSFFKRQLNIKPGAHWHILDQIDFGIGALALLSTIYFPGIIMSITLLVILVIAHIIIKHIGDLIGIR